MRLLRDFALTMRRFGRDMSRALLRQRHRPHKGLFLKLSPYHRLGRSHLTRQTTGDSGTFGYELLLHHVLPAEFNVEPEGHHRTVVPTRLAALHRDNIKPVPRGDRRRMRIPFGTRPFDIEHSCRRGPEASHWDGWVIPVVILNEPTPYTSPRQCSVNSSSSNHSPMESWRRSIGEEGDRGAGLNTVQPRHDTRRRATLFHNSITRRPGTNVTFATL